jgi:hypothetical protein
VAFFLHHGAAQRIAVAVYAQGGHFIAPFLLLWGKSPEMQSM